MAAGGIIMTNNTSSRSRQVNVSQMVKIAVLIAIMLILNYTLGLPANWTGRNYFSTNTRCCREQCWVLQLVHYLGLSSE